MYLYTIIYFLYYSAIIEKSFNYFFLKEESMSRGRDDFEPSVLH